MFCVYHFQMLEQTVYLLLESLAQPNNLNLDFALIANNSGFDKYSFQLITLLKQDLNWRSSLELSCIDKVNSGT